MTETLKPCRECGAPCSVQVFPNATLWVCIHNTKLEGGRRSDTAYLSAEDWNTRAPDDVAQIVAWLRTNPPVIGMGHGSMEHRCVYRARRLEG